jgi:hypothetical protein
MEILYCNNSDKQESQASTSMVGLECVFRKSVSAKFGNLRGRVSELTSAENISSGVFILFLKALGNFRWVASLYFILLSTTCWIPPA